MQKSREYVLLRSIKYEVCLRTMENYECIREQFSTFTWYLLSFVCVDHVLLIGWCTNDLLRRL